MLREHGVAVSFVLLVSKKGVSKEGALTSSLFKSRLL